MRLDSGRSADESITLPKSVSAFSQMDWVLVGVLLAGGAHRFVDREDVTVLCYALHPAAFRWSKYDYPNIERVQGSYRKLRQRFGDRLLVTPGGTATERRLTGEGLARALALTEMYLGKRYGDVSKTVAAARRRIKRGNAAPSPAPRLTETIGDGNEARVVLGFITAHPAYRAWAQGKLDAVELWQIADVLQCLPDSTPSVFAERLARYEAMAVWWRRPEVREFFTALRARILR